MSKPTYSSLRDATAHARDSLELGSLASSSRSSAEVSGTSSPSGPPSSRKLSFDNEDPLHDSSSRPGGSNRNATRTFSVSSAFDFAPPLFPIPATTGYTSLGDPSITRLDATVEGGSLEKHKSLTYLNGLSLVIGLVIGSGIFSSPSEVNANAGSPGAALVLWTVAGLLAWTGAASYAELGGAIPLNGGAQVYLSKIYGEGVGFMYSWCMVCALKPGSGAIISIIFGEYLVRAFVGADAPEVNPLITKAVAVGALVVVTILNAISTRIAARTADIMMFFKFMALLGVTIMGIVVAATGFSWNGDASTDWKTKGWFEGTNTDLSDLAIALWAGLWAFDGWDNTNYVVGEFVNPTRDLPRVIHTAMPATTVFYLLANISYFLVLPLEITSNSASRSIGVDFGSKVLGSLGALILALAVSGSCFGALNAAAFSTSRLFYVAANEGYLPAVVGTMGWRGKRVTRLPNQPGAAKHGGALTRIFAKLCSGETWGTMFLTPIPALLLHFVLTTFYIILGTFRTLITFAGVIGYAFYFLTVLGLLVLRVKEPDLERPYRCWVTTPIIFCCVSLFLLSRSLVAQPLTTLLIVGFIVVGGCVFIWKRSREAPSQKHGGRDDVGWRIWKRWRRN